MIMYYGGDAIDIALIVVLCHQWYVATRPAHHRTAPTVRLAVSGLADAARPGNARSTPSAHLLPPAINGDPR